MKGAKIYIVSAIILFSIQVFGTEAGAPSLAACSRSITDLTDGDLSKKTDQLFLLLSSFSKSDREKLLQMMSGDRSEISEKEMILQHLLARLNYKNERDTIRILKRSVESDEQSRLAHLPVVRNLMRTFGSTSTAYFTPDFLAEEIAELYSNLNSDDQKEVALLTVLGDLQLWGEEALQNAFIKLGKTPEKAAKFVSNAKRKNKWLQGRRFLFREEGTIYIWKTGEPAYYADFRKIPDVEKFLSYFKKRNQEKVDKMIPLSEEARAKEVRFQSTEVPVVDKDDDEPETQEQPDHVEASVEKIDWSVTRSNLVRSNDALQSAIRWTVPPLESLNAALPADTDIFRQAALRFTNYFSANGDRTLERDELLKTFKLIVLSKGNMLVVGITGTAKTTIGEGVLGNIHVNGAPDFLNIPFERDTTSDQVHGALSLKQSWKQDKLVRNQDGSITRVRHLSLDEIDKVSPRFWPTLFNVLNRTGTLAKDIRTEVVFATANRYVSQFYDIPYLMAEDVQPFFDRFDSVFVVPRTFYRRDSLLEVGSLQSSPVDSFNYSDLEKLRSLMDLVVVPNQMKLIINLLIEQVDKASFDLEVKSEEERKKSLARREKTSAAFKSSRIYNPKTITKALGKWIRSIVVQRWIDSGGTSDLSVTLDDIINLKHFLIMGGPSDSELRGFVRHSRSVDEKSQYEYKIKMSEEFDRIAQRLKNDMEVNFEAQQNIKQIKAAIVTLQQQGLDPKVVQNLIDNVGQDVNSAIEMLKMPEEKAAITSSHIFALLHRTEIIELLQSFFQVAQSKIPATDD